MKRTIVSFIGSIAGIFFTFAIIQAMWAIPDFRKVMQPIFEQILQGLLIGAIIFAVIGAVFFYISIKGR